MEISHSIKNIELIDNKIYGDVEILNTPCGKTVKLLNGNYRMGLRASGRTEEKVINRGEQTFSEIDPYCEENWNDDDFETVKKIEIFKIYTWDIIPLQKTNN